jgi:hypothetical protein
MARTFSTLFSYNGQTYTAVISNFDGTVNIYVPDETLHHILPRGKASCNLSQAFKIDAAKLSPAQHLILSILNSIEEFDKALKDINDVKQCG